jgi:curli production assembly/transport component CsgG
MRKILLVLFLVNMLGGCAIIQSTGVSETKPTVTKSMMQKEFDSIAPPISNKSVSVAVYSFKDLTGQRRPQANVASLSTAVTQGADAFLIKALQDVGRGRWFEVVERVGIDNLTKERLIIKQMREAYEGAGAKPLMPMQFAGMIIEGGIVGYDTSTNSGGAGMRILGIGKQTQWTQDVVTISLRAVSVNTGKILISVTVQKTILSSADSATALKFYDMGTKAFEAETGLTINEPGTYAVKSAIEMAVVEMIKEGARKNVWDFKKDTAEAPVVEVSKLEDKKDVLVYKDSASNGKNENTSTSQQSDTGTKNGAESKKNTTAESTTEQYTKKVMYFVVDAYVVELPEDNSQRIWFFKRGTQVEVISNTSGWVQVLTGDSKKGYVRDGTLTSSISKTKSKRKKETQQ